MIEVTRTSPLNSVQDLGRINYRHMGVSVSGVMDSLALIAANTVLGNDKNNAGIEIQTYPFEVVFHQDTAICITGANSRARLDSKVLPPWWVCHVKRGQKLSIQFPKSGCRTYLCVAGGIQVPTVLSSRSTALRGSFGGFEGRCLQVKDQIVIHENRDLSHVPDGMGIEPPDIALKHLFPTNCLGVPLIRAIPAGDYELFKDTDFWESNWTISMQSDRTGYRLTGSQLVPSEIIEMRSYGLLPGIVQIPPSGQPIIQLSDANTAGGYPKIACVIEEDLWRLGQLLPGSEFQFVPSTVEEASNIRYEIDRWLKKIEVMSQRVNSLVSPRI
ncbi:biotin-dependent carboxyltransferase family protein [Vibrio sp.]|nr:biotin-dependent carboxyltransferase family protein [Vibrio sp.]